MFFLTILLAQLFSASGQNPSNYNPKGWTAAQTFLSEFMDSTTDPCTNFTRFMCAKFGQGNGSMEGYYTWETETQKTSHIQTMVEAITAIDLNDTKTHKPARLVRNFYDQCITNVMDPNTMKAMYDVLSPILGPHPAFVNSSKSDEDIWYLMGKIQSEFGEAFAMDRPQVNIMSSDGKTRQGWLIMTPMNPAIIRYFANTVLIRDLAKMSNIELDEKHMTQIVSESVAFFRNWQKAVTATGGAEVVEFGNFSSMPNVSWPSFWKGLMTNDMIKDWLEVKKPEQVGQGVVGTNMMEAIAQAFNNAPVRAVKTVLYDYLLRKVSTPGMNLRSDQLACWNTYGEEKTATCVEYAVQQATPAAVRVYFDHIGEDLPTWRNDFLLIGKNIFSAMRLLLNSIDYMTPKSKEAVNEKIDAVNLNPGIPTWIMDDEKVVSNSIAYDEKQSFAANVMRRSGEIFREELRAKLLDPENAESDPGPTMQINSNFLPWKNNLRINVFLGYNLPPYFSQFHPLSIKYALTGFVIGHELMHAFDPGNIVSVLYGQVLSLDELENYQKGANCLITQYSRACYNQTGLCQMGSLALKDNVADIGGLKTAFAAYQFHKSLIGEEPPVESFTKYTHDQLFFMAFQRVYCASTEPPAVWAVQNHSPSTTRAKVALRNSPHFAKAFSCPVGSNEAPVTPCKMWGDILN